MTIKQKLQSKLAPLFHKILLRCKKNQKVVYILSEVTPYFDKPITFYRRYFLDGVWQICPIWDITDLIAYYEALKVCKNLGVIQ